MERAEFLQNFLCYNSIRKTKFLIYKYPFTSVELTSNSFLLLRFKDQTLPLLTVVEIVLDIELGFRRLIFVGKYLEK